MFSDIPLDDSYEGNLRKDGRSVRIVVTISSGPKTTKVSACGFYIVSLFHLPVVLFVLTPFVLIHLTTLQGKQSQDYLIGSIGVSGRTKWDVLDGVIRRLFKVNRPLLIGSGQLFWHIIGLFYSYHEKCLSKCFMADVKVQSHKTRLSIGWKLLKIM